MTVTAMSDSTWGSFRDSAWNLADSGWNAIGDSIWTLHDSIWG
jgi:hypothetical protein